jgi:hypothetical protein
MTESGKGPGCVAQQMGMPLPRIQVVLYFRARDHFPRRQFGQMKTKKTKHDAANKKISTASRRKNMPIDEYGQEDSNNP